jgi:hypothetical protein
MDDRISIISNLSGNYLTGDHLQPKAQHRTFRGGHLLTQYAV